MFPRTRNVLTVLMRDLRGIVIRAQRRVDPDVPTDRELTERELSESSRL